MVVANNIIAMNAQRQFNIVSSNKKKSTERLSSGYRINRAADDAAGLTISEKMRSQIRGLTQASNNAQDGISLVQIADGALEEVHEMLQRMHELTIYAANGTLSDSDRTAIQGEFSQLQKEIDRVDESTMFNNKRVFGIGDGNVVDIDNVIQESPKKPNVDKSINKMLGDYTVYGDIKNKCIYDAPNKKILITDNCNIEIDGNYKTTDSIEIAAGKTVNLIVKNINYDDMSANISGLILGTGATLNITIEEDNTIQLRCLNSGNNTNAGISVGDNATINITKDSTGTLSVINGEYGNCRVYGAAIGSDSGKKGGEINIYGGTVYASVGNSNTNWPESYSAAIGSGYGGEMSNINIYGGKVTAVSTDYGTGIGSGVNQAKVGDINIYDGDVLAISGKGGTGAGVGIGSGWESVAGNINIYGGNVEASARDSGAGIGSGKDGTTGDINIYNGGVNASSVYNGAGIGSGMHGTTGDINIYGGNIDAESQDGAGIGSGFSGITGNINIYGGNIDTFANDHGAGIGSGFFGTAGNITIGGGTVTTGSRNGSGLGDGVSSISSSSFNTLGNPTITATSMRGIDISDTSNMSNWSGTINGVFYGISSSTPKIDGDWDIFVGASSNQQNIIAFNTGNISCTGLGIGVEKVNVETIVAAEKAIDKVSKAIDKVSAKRSNLGAIQNRLEHTIKNLDNIVENTTAAESRIRDADMAKEMVNLSLLNILEQAGLSMMSQANQSNQGVLSLLQ